MRTNVQIAKALLQNEHIHMGLYLHKLISPMLTCLVTKQLGSTAAEDHWSLRQEAAGVIALICRLFGSKEPNLVQRISKQLVKALTDPERPLPHIPGRRDTRMTPRLQTSLGADA